MYQLYFKKNLSPKTKFKIKNHYMHRGFQPRVPVSQMIYGGNNVVERIPQPILKFQISKRKLHDYCR